MKIRADQREIAAKMNKFDPNNRNHSGRFQLQYAVEELTRKFR